MRNYFKRVLQKVVAIVVVVAIGAILFGLSKLLGWLGTLVPKMGKLDIYTIIMTVLICFLISLLGEVVGWIWRKVRKADNNDGDDDDDV